MLAGRHADVRIDALPADRRDPWHSVEAAVACDGRAVGTFGILAPAALATFGLEGTFAAAELELEPLWAGFPPDARAEALPAFPAIERDLSAIVPERATWAEVESIARGLGLANLESVGFVGTYRGAQTGAGRKSVTMRLVFRAHDRTLRREDADAPMAALADALAARLGATIRG
jgi:phenylalanyl-tRNA synthetase beta chain